MHTDCRENYYVVEDRVYGTRLEYIGREGVAATETVTTSVRDAFNYPQSVTFASQPTAPYVAWSDPSNGGTREWLAPLKIIRQDGGATSTEPGAGLTHLLVAQGYGFNIPPNATITAIAVDVWRYVVNGNATNYVIDAVVKLIKPGGALSATNKAWIGDVYKWTGTIDVPEISRYGLAGDLWGETWTPAMINHGDFGVAIAATTTSPAGTCAPAIDFVGIRVTYTI